MTLRKNNLNLGLFFVHDSTPGMVLLMLQRVALQTESSLTLCSHPLTKQLQAQVQEALDEMLFLAERENTTASLAFLEHSMTCEGMDLLEQGLFEILRAYVSCAFEVDFPMELSQQRWQALVAQAPSLNWAKEVYLQRFPIAELRPDLHKNEALLQKTQHRLQVWLGSP